MSKLIQSQSSQIVDNVVVCINHILNSTLFHEFDNDFMDKVGGYLLCGAHSTNLKKRIGNLKKAVAELEKMNRKCKDERVTEVIESINFLNIILENEAEFPISFFTNKFPFVILGVNSKDDSDYSPSESDYSSDEYSSDEDNDDSEDNDSDDEESENEHFENDSDSDSEDNDEIDFSEKSLNYDLSRDCLMALVSVLRKIPDAKVLSEDFDDELVSVEEFLREAISDFILLYEDNEKKALFFFDDDLERVMDLLNGIYEDVPDKYEEQIFLIRDRIIWARMMLEMEEKDFMKELKAFHIKGIKLHKN